MACVVESLSEPGCLPQAVRSVCLDFTSRKRHGSRFHENMAALETCQIHLLGFPTLGISGPPEEISGK